MYDKKDGLCLSPQLLRPFKDEVLKGVGFRLWFEGREISDLEQARPVAKTCGTEGVDEVTPDPMMTCPSCGHHFRVGRRLDGNR